MAVADNSSPASPFAPDTTETPRERSATTAASDTLARLGARDLGTTVEAALRRWVATGLSPEQIASLQTVTFDLADMPGWQLGSAAPGHITLDTDAADKGDILLFDLAARRKVQSLRRPIKSRMSPLSTP